ncbi:MAG: DUF481 domain-containing protein [Myxococcota bacterium]
MLRCTFAVLFTALFATLGSTNVALAQPADPAQLTDRATTDAPDENVTTFAVNGGFVGSTGNTQAWTLTLGASFRLVRGRHALSLDEAFTYGRADVDINDDTDFEDTVRNSVARLRYDVFLTERDAIFASIVHRWDTFAGLDTRLQNQIGYLRNLYVAKDDEDEQTQRLWVEAGYDLTWDNLHPDPLLVDNPDAMDPDACAGDAPPGDCFLTLDDTVIVHAARFYAGYDGKLGENAQLVIGLEVLPALEGPDQGEDYDVRLNFDAALRTTLFDDLKLELAFRLLHDTEPVPGALSTDTQTLVSLIYSVL